MLFRISIPTIPSHNRIFGYGEAGNGILFPINNTVKTFTGNKDDCVGPGEYETNGGPIRPSKTPLWKMREDSNRYGKGPNLGPG